MIREGARKWARRSLEWYTLNWYGRTVGDWGEEFLNGWKGIIERREEIYKKGKEFFRSVLKDCVYRGGSLKEKIVQSPKTYVNSDFFKDEKVRHRYRRFGLNSSSIFDLKPLEMGDMKAELASLRREVESLKERVEERVPGKKDGEITGGFVDCNLGNLPSYFEVLFKSHSLTYFQIHLPNDVYITFALEAPDVILGIYSNKELPRYLDKENITARRKVFYRDLHDLLTMQIALDKEPWGIGFNKVPENTDYFLGWGRLNVVQLGLSLLAFYDETERDNSMSP